MARNDDDRWRDILVDAVARPLLFVAWSLVVWGTLYGLAFLWAVVARGPSAAWRQAMAHDAKFGAFNLALAGLAAVVWGLVIAAARRARSRRRP